MSVSELRNLIETSPEYAAIAAFILAVIIVWIIIRYINKESGNKKITKIIKKMATGYVQNIAIPDGLEGYVFIDYLVLTPTGILVINVQDYNGFLFGGENINEWTQMIGHKSYKFKNPLPQVEHHVQSVKLHVDDVPVRGRIVFSSAGEFPKGIPQGVSTIGSLKEDVSFTVVGNAVPEIYLYTWKKLLELAKSSSNKVSKHG